MINYLGVGYISLWLVVLALKRDPMISITFIKELNNSPGEFRTSPKCNILKGFERYFFTYNDPYPNITRTFLRFYNFV